MKSAFKKMPGNIRLQNLLSLQYINVCVLYNDVDIKKYNYMCKQKPKDKTVNFNINVQTKYITFTLGK